MRIIRGAKYSRLGGPSGRSPRLTKAELQHRMARQAAIDRALSRYMKLVCGHYQTLEEDERVSVWRPRKGVTYCDTCQDWVDIAKPPPPVDYGDTPMF